MPAVNINTRTLHAADAYKLDHRRMYPENTNLLFAAFMNISNDNLLGKARETFALNQLQNAGLDVYFTTQGDFACLDYSFEVGGKHKTTTQISQANHGYVLADGILTGIGKKIPLYLLGFLS